MGFSRIWPFEGLESAKIIELLLKWALASHGRGGDESF